ncbi:MAG: J domain-containing protein [Hyphomicrobiaceae bacterium]
MFERSRVDNMSQGQQVAVPADITLDDGTHLKGRFNLPANRPVHEVLNGPMLFLEFQAYGGEPALIAKTAIRSIRLVNVPSAGHLRAGMRPGETFDPHAVLGVKVGASPEELRKAYHERAKAYHPDRYATAELPAEVSDYLAAMARRVNIAFKALDTTHQTAKQRAEAKAAPVYTSPQRV